MLFINSISASTVMVRLYFELFFVLEKALFGLQLATPSCHFPWEVWPFGYLSLRHFPKGFKGLMHKLQGKLRLHNQNFPTLGEHY